MTQRSLELTAETGITFDAAVISEEALGWAREYNYRLVTGLTDTTRKLVQQSVSTFVETPGMTRADLESLLAPGFGESRASMIAVTEVTRAYSEATNQQQALIRDETGIEMRRVWNSLRDSVVCPVCAPLHGMPEEDWKAEFPNGPPAHPGCRCSTSLTMDDEATVRAEAIASQTARERVMREKVEGEKPGAELTPHERLIEKVRQVRPDATDDQLEMFADVMTLDRERYIDYAAKLGIEDGETLADEYFTWHKEKTRQEAKQRWDYQAGLSIQRRGFEGRGSAMVNLGDEMQELAEMGTYGQSLDDVEALLAKHNVRLEVLNDTPAEGVYEYTSKLAHMLERNPVLQRTLDDYVDVISYREHRWPGQTATAEYDPLTRTINVYPLRLGEDEWRIRNGSTWIHEIGHAAEDYAPNLAESRVFGELDQRIVSMYGYGSFDEDFAETYTALVGKWEMGQVPTWVPEKYQYMLDHVPGLSEWLE